MRLVRFAADTVVNVSRDDAIISDDSFFTVFLAWRQKEKEEKQQAVFEHSVLDKIRQDENILNYYTTPKGRGEKDKNTYVR